MNNTFIYNLKQPCKNRNIDLKNNKDGSVNLDGKTYRTMGECEDYIESKKRLYI